MAERYSLRPAAVEDMESIIDYLSESNPLAAVRFVEAAQATFEHLAFMPKAYPSFTCDDARLEGVRCRPLTGAFHRYVVFYRSDEKRLDVLRVLHASRDLDHIFRESP